MKEQLKPVGKVFPSNLDTVHVKDDDTYGGAHQYTMQNCLGFKDGKTQYDGSKQTIQFVQKNDDGTMIPGLQSEQLLIALIDRHKKLNARFPSKDGAEAISLMEIALECLEKRVRERMDRGVMGDLKK